MTKAEIFTAALAQTLAPILYNLCGRPPEEMGFPIYETKAQVENHLQQMFDPVAYWTDKAGEIAAGLTAVLQTGGVDLEDFDYQAALPAIAAMRPDLPA